MSRQSTLYTLHFLQTAAITRKRVKSLPACFSSVNQRGRQLKCFRGCKQALHYQQKRNRKEPLSENTHRPLFTGLSNSLTRHTNEEKARRYYTMPTPTSSSPRTIATEIASLRAYICLCSSPGCLYILQTHTHIE